MVGGATAAETNCSFYSATASAYAEVWRQYAYDDQPAPHYKMSYNAVDGVEDSWSIKYNLLWQRLLGLSGPFAWDEIVPAEIAYYKRHANEFGVPLDPRHTYVKTDWLSWAAAMTADDDDFRVFIDPIFQFANTTQSRGPFTDLYDTVTGKQTHESSFIARPVIGGLFAKVLMS